MITRDVNFKESTFGISPTLLQETIEYTTLYLDTMDVNDEYRQTDFTQEGKCNSCSTNEHQETVASSPGLRGAGLEQASATISSVNHRVKRRTTPRVELEEEDNRFDDNEKTHHLLPSVELVLKQSTLTTYLSQQSFTLLSGDWLKFTDLRQSVQN